MSAILEISTREISTCFSELALLIPKGSKDIPVGVDLSNGKLSFYYNAGSVYLSSFDVDSNEVARCTVLFYDISSLLLSTGIAATTLEFTEAGLHISNDVVDLTLSRGYSSVTFPEFPMAGYTDLPATLWKDNLKDVLNMGLDKLYAKASPIISMGDGTCVLKYPNTWVKCKTPSFNMTKVIDIEHVRLLTRFNPNAYMLPTHDSMLFKRGNAYLMLPCRPAKDIDTTAEFFTETLGKMSEPVNINVANYTDNVRSLSKLCSKSVCNLTIFEKGVKTTITETSAAMSVTCGESGKVIGTAQVPINVWLVFLRALKTDRIQILIGGDILCLRNQSLIILTHARN